MKAFLMLGILGLAGPAGVEARECSPRRHGPLPESRVEFHRRHDNLRHFLRHDAPEVERVWVPARYETRVVDYDQCGKPITRSVCLHEGYWTTRPACD
jgi:hypothetical protein